MSDMSHATILKQLFAAYPTVQIGEHTIAVYMRRLAEIPPDELQIVVDRAIDTLKFPDTVSELKEAWRWLDLPGARARSYSIPGYEYQRLTGAGAPIQIEIKEDKNQ